MSRLQVRFAEQAIVTDWTIVDYMLGLYAACLQYIWKIELHWRSCSAKRIDFRQTEISSGLVLLSHISGWPTTL